MAPPSEPIDCTTSSPLFSLSNGVLSIKGVPLLTQVPNNVCFNSLSSICQKSDAPLHLIKQAHSNSHEGGFLGFTQTNPSNILKNPLGQFSNRPFLSVFRFKTWWSTMRVGSNGSELQMETQWILFDLHETGFDSKVVPVKVSPGLDGTMEDLAVDKIVEAGIGLVDPDQVGEFYDAMHSYPSGVGITGVKVDVIHRGHLTRMTAKLLRCSPFAQTLEYVCEEYGGRVKLAKAYYDGLSKSLVKNFQGTGIISSMQQCNDFFFLGTSQIPFGRAGDDFWFQDPNGDPMGVYWLQGVHMIHCAFNSLWMGQMIQPDWDMFQSDHCCAKLESLFFLNKYAGVIGAFNCQGAGWDTKEHKNRGYSQFYKPVSGSVHVNDIEWDQRKETSTMGKAGEFAVYLDQAEKLLLLTRKADPIEITLQPSSFEIFSFVPIKIIDVCDAKFAPMGLTNMFNSGGTIVEAEYAENQAKVKVRGGGRFLCYSSVKPKRVSLDGVDIQFEFLEGGKLMMDVCWQEEKEGTSEVVIQCCKNMP